MIDPNLLRAALLAAAERGDAEALDALAALAGDPDGLAAFAPGDPVDRFAEPAADEVALAGPDGRRAADLLAAAKRHGREAFARLARAAVERLLDDPDPLSVPVLFTDGELRELADTLAAANATADLLGRSRVARLAERAAAGAEKFAEDDPFRAFDEPPPALRPEAAIDYFRRLVPTLAVAPERYGPRLDRQAFTLAAAADEAVLRKVQEAILRRLTEGRGNTAAEVEDLLDAAGVGERNPQYADMVVRTNLIDSYTAGQSAELATPAMKSLFPAWRYHATVDGRERPEHGARDGRLYPNSATFAQVRGTEARDVCNCRCTFSPVGRAELESGGQPLETTW